MEGRKISLSVPCALKLDVLSLNFSFNYYELYVFIFSIFHLESKKDTYQREEIIKSTKNILR